jgi:hypothetical protein
VVVKMPVPLEIKAYEEERGVAQTGNTLSITQLSPATTQLSAAPGRAGFLLPAGGLLHLPDHVVAAAVERHASTSTGSSGDESGSESDSNSSAADGADPGKAVASETDDGFQLVAVLPPAAERAPPLDATVEADSGSESDEDGSDSESGSDGGSSGSSGDYNSISDMSADEAEQLAAAYAAGTHRRGAVKIPVPTDGPAPEECSADYGSSSGSGSDSESDDMEQEQRSANINNTNNSPNVAIVTSGKVEESAPPSQAPAVGQLLSAPVQRRVAAPAIPSYASPSAVMLAVQFATALKNRSRANSEASSGAKKKTKKTRKASAPSKEATAPRSRILSKKASKK